MGMYLEAVNTLLEVVKQDKQSITGHFFLGMAYVKFANFQNAEQYLRIGMQLDVLKAVLSPQDRMLVKQCWFKCREEKSKKMKGLSENWLKWVKATGRY